MLTKFTQKKKGFSLTEMVVVIATVATISVAVTAGVKMVGKTRFVRINQDIQEYTKAVESFEKLYGALPGDISDVSALPSAAAGTEGNGDGTINSAAEALNFWLHLSVTSLIAGNYDGTSTNVPGTGVPAGSINSSGFNVYDPTAISDDSIPDQALVFEFAGFSSSANNLPILRPADAKTLDANNDDGKPSTGNIQAIGLSCFDDNSTPAIDEDDTYNVSQDSIACHLLFIVRKPDVTRVGSDISGSCVEIGEVREKTDATCPAGMTGKVMEMCAPSGNWVTSTSSCTSIKCPGDLPLNTTRVLECLDNQTGHIVEKCISPGIWTVDSNTCAASTSGSCTNGQTREIACPWGKTGKYTQLCSGGNWTNTSDGACADITCSGGGVIGAVRTSGTAENCNAQSAEYSTSSPSHVEEVCLMDGTWGVVSNKCLPNYGTCTAPDTRDIKCPPGEEGNHYQECTEKASGTDYWVTKKDRCRPVRCSGKSLGTTRTSSTECADGGEGSVVEICKTQYNVSKSQWEGVWVETSNMCTN